LLKKLFQLVAILGLAASAGAQETHLGKTLLVFPFGNNSAAPGLEWIAEAFPEALGHNMASSTIFNISRDDRLYACERLGIPNGVQLSRASMYSVAREMDADYVVFGSYDFDGSTFKATAQLLDMNRVRLSSAVSESGPLPDLILIERALTWDLLRIIDADLPVSRNQFVNSSPPIRLDAFENYIRGIIAPNGSEAIDRLKKAIALEPEYIQAILQLGKRYYEDHDYGNSKVWLNKIPKSDQSALEANFYLGLSAYYSGDFAASESAFAFVASRLPLTEVYNDLGVAESRSKKPSAIDYFRRAVQDDPQDPDYRFNLAVALFRGGDRSGAAAQIKEALSLKPSDREAKGFQELVNSGATAAAGGPLERIKNNYDENSFRQLALEIDNQHEKKMEGADAETRAKYRVKHGSDLLAQGFSIEAMKEAHEAIRLDPTNDGAHLLLARSLEQLDDAQAATGEVEFALRLRKSAEAYVEMAILQMRSGKFAEADQSADDALQLEPANVSALALRREIASKLSPPAAEAQHP
jgi:Tfp pilus assembly protein PilF/TolB-like protein